MLEHVVEKLKFSKEKSFLFGFNFSLPTNIETF